MDLQSAIEFIAATLIIVVAGVLLGMALARRSKEKAYIDHDRLEAYVDLVGAMDGLRQADEEHKQVFINAYYRALMFAPDSVVRSLNTFLQTVTASEGDYDPAAQASARDQVVLAMRQDTHGELDKKSKIKPVELYSIEVNNAPRGSVITPDSTVLTPGPEPTPAPNQTKS